MSRVFFALVSGLAEEALLAATVLIVLPRFGVVIPPWGLVGLMLLLAINNTVFFLIGRRALKRKPVAGLAEMTGIRGEVVCRLAPGGLVSIRGELWQAISESGEIEAGRQVTVLRQQGLTLIVAADEPAKINEAGA